MTHLIRRGKTRAGKPCKSPVVDRDGFCPSHGPDGTARMRHRGQKGGAATKARYRGNGLPRDRLGPLETIQDAQRWLRMIAEAVGSREITHSEGQSMTTAVREWVRAEGERLKAEDLAALQEQVAELRRQRIGVS